MPLVDDQEFRLDMILQKMKRIHVVAEDTETHPTDRKKINLLKAMTANLDDLFVEFDEVCTKLNSLYSKQSPQTVKDLKPKYAEFEKLLFNVKAIVMTIVVDDSGAGPSGVPRLSNRSSTGETSAQISLPKLQLINFGGDLLEWPSFHDLFYNSVHIQDSISDIHKFMHLKSCLVGEARSLIASFRISGSSYKVAWELLVKRYNDPNRLAYAYLEALFDLPIIPRDAKRLRSLSASITEYTGGLIALEHSVDSWNYPLVFLFRRKLTPPLRERWEEYALKKLEPSVNDFLRFLDDEVRILESATPLSANNKGQMNTQNKKGTSNKSGITTLVAGTSVADKSVCPCNKTHELSQCARFSKMPVKARLNFVKSRRLCLSCFSKDHFVPQCTTNRSCSTCEGKHADLLCFKNIELQKGSDEEHKSDAGLSPSSNAKDSVKCVCVQTSKPSNGHVVLLATVQAYAVTPNGQQQVITVLIDTASQGTFMTESCARRLGLDFQCCRTPIFGLGNAHAGVSRGLVNVSLLSMHSVSKIKLDVQAMIVEKIVKCPKMEAPPKLWSHVKGLTLADPDYYLDKNVDLLLGAEWYAQVVLDSPIVGPAGAPDVMHTVFGYCLIGKVDVNSQNKIHVLCSTFEETIDKSIRRFWEHEEPPSSLSKYMSNEESECECHFETTFTRRDGRYIVRLPFRQTPANLGDSYALAKRRYYALERRLAKNPALFEKYRQFMRDYIDQNHMVRAITPPNHAAHYYIPHHCIHREDEELSRFRVVFDCSMKTANGISLNQVVHVGPKLQQDICGILFRFRLHNVCLVADIRQMYRNIGISEHDYDFQRIFWRFQPTEEVQEYTLTTVTYGNAAAPFLALRTLRQLVADEGAEYPEASRVILQNTFVDDTCTSVPTLESALKLQRELVALLSRGKFTLRKWMSNRPEVLAEIPPSDCAMNPDIFKFQDLDGTLLGTAILGLAWNPVTDVFSFQVKVDGNSNVTKRNILSQVARIYDPLGLLAPITFYGKWIIQHLWQLGLGWDEVPPRELVVKWEQFQKELVLLSNFSLDRCVRLDTAVDVQLHGFSDSSERGYAAVVYLRSTTPDGGTHTALLIAKSKVAPLKKISLPRLELCGAVLLSDLLAYVTSILQDHCKLSSVTAWCDSSVTLQWIKSSPHRWKTFVANRVSHIQHNISPACFRHVPSEFNPSDLASRGTLPRDFLENQLWKWGPEWLALDASHWPNDLPHSGFDQVNQADMEARVISLPLNASTANHWMEKFSSYSKLLRTLAYWLRYFSYLRNPKTNTFTIGPPTSGELQSATIRLAHLVQLESFSSELRALARDANLTPPKLRKLRPFLDDSGVIRVGGRLKHSNLPFKSKYPILLPKSHHITRLLIDHYHITYLHTGALHLHSLLQSSFWIVNAREVIAKQLSRCIKCFRHKPVESRPLMGDLPRSRVDPVSPFYKTGVDYGGPYNLLMARTRKPKVYKGYICLFVCFATKAIHLEAVSDLTTDAFLAALRRFVARRGSVREIYSDCGTNFVGAKRKIADWYETVNSKKCNERVAIDLANKGIDWKLTAARSPHLNGLMEGGIKSVKKHLKRVIGEQLLTYEEFNTILVQIEAVVNSRPLTPISSDPSDIQALTPGHFLLQNPDLALEPAVPTDLRGRWLLIQQLVKSFWDRWHKDYLNTLQIRAKWTKTSPNLKVGDVVLMKEPHLDPCHWRLARVSRVSPGADGIVRVAEVTNSRGTYSRAVRKLCPLPLNDSQ